MSRRNGPVLAGRCSALRVCSILVPLALALVPACRRADPGADVRPAGDAAATEGARTAEPHAPAAGMRAYVDPETGELTDKPPPGAQPLPPPSAGADDDESDDRGVTIRQSPQGGIIAEPDESQRQY